MGVRLAGGRAAAALALAIMLGIGAGGVPACGSSAPGPPPKLTRAELRVQLFDYLSGFAGGGPQRQAILFLFSDEPRWQYRYLGNGEWSVTIPAEADGQRFLDEPAEWRLTEATRSVRPANGGAEAILRGLSRPLGETTPRAAS